jgi:sulfite reductase (NADPH) flavoprotein alpha-component
VLPDSAPFTPAQRAWLNGFFAGLMGARAVAEDGRAVPQVAAPRATPHVAEAEESFPWHDPALSLDERMKLAEGRPRSRLLMAAMAQLDCGACGYLCRTYAEAVDRGEEKDLTRCAPGGKETARKLKELAALPAGAAAAPAQISTPGAGTARPVHGRHNPFPARVLACTPLNRTGSDKDTRHIALDLKGGGPTYQAGASLGVFPENCPDTVQWILEALDASGGEKVAAPDGTLVKLSEALLRHYTITQPSSELLGLLAESATDAAERAAIKAHVDGAELPRGEEVLDVLTHFRSARPSPERFVAALTPLRPRLYSISSSPAAHAGEVHLTVGVVRFVNSRGRQCRGVASTFLGERVRPGQKVRVFVQPSHGFAPPASGNTPIIMVGPGTGIAPFRAFLHERRAAGAKGRNWLFFGGQRRACDFLYEDELTGMHRDGFLTRLDTAFSRDQAEKVYVQHRMLKNSAQLWAWLKDGAHFYVCGDAKRMAADVDAALRKVVAEQGGMSPDAAKAFVADLAKAKRYQRDVY